MIMKKIRNSFIVTRDTQNREIIMQKQAPIVEKKNKKNVVMHIKSMALVLVAALVISAFSAAIVHSLAKSGSGSGRSRDYAAKSVDMSKKDFASTEIFTAKGKKTDAGDWNCFNESGCARISGEFDPSTGKYHFAAKAMRAGTDHVSLSYKSENGKWQTKNITLNIDKNLNISIA